jgi:hypothetical protein
VQICKFLDEIEKKNCNLDSNANFSFSDSENFLIAAFALQVGGTSK